MVFRRSFVLSLALGSVVVFTACGGREASQTNVAVKTIEDRFAVRIGDRTVQLQLAVEPAEMQKGLMFRPSMGRDEGMLFVYRVSQQLSFWMQNTIIPLDIGFFDASGELKEIYPLHPHDERSVTSRGKDLLYALEMNQGWFKEAGIKPGAKLDLAAVSAGLKARGLKPLTGR